MAYNVTKSDGSQLITLVDGAFNDSVCDLKLLGKGVVNFGEIMAENMVWLLEHFASESEPLNPLLGQLWFNKQDNLLYIYLGSGNWKLPFVAPGEAIEDDIEMNGYRLLNLADPNSGQHAVTLAYLEANYYDNTENDTLFLLETTADGKYLSLNGGSLAGPLLLTGTPMSATEAVTKQYVDDSVGVLATASAAYLDKAGDSMTGILNMSGNQIVGLPYPDTTDDAVSLGYLEANYNRGDDVNGWTAAQYTVAATASGSGALAWDLDIEQIKILTLSGNGVLSAPTNLHAGATYVLIVKQDIIGGRTLDFSDPTYKFPGGIDPILSTSANAIDVLFFVCDGTSLLGVGQNDFY